jgi:hypothetical protein
VRDGHRESGGAAAEHLYPVLQFNWDGIDQIYEPSSESMAMWMRGAEITRAQATKYDPSAKSW